MNDIPIINGEILETAVGEQLSLLADVLDEPGKPVVFTSPRPGDGTSTVALCVAASIAEKRSQGVLYVDCDFRTSGHPRLRAYRQGPGLTDCLADGGRQGILGTSIEDLFVLPPGAPPRSPHRLLQSEAFPRTMSSFAQSYRNVIIDAPPVLPYAEALILGRYGYPIILVADGTKTRIGELMEAKSRITNAKGTIAGVILNRRPYYLPEFVYRRL